MSIAENIKRLRLAHGLSQAELGAIAGVSDKAVSTWETGAKVPKLSTVQKIADHFHLSKSEIYEDKPTNASLKFALFGDTEVDDDVLDEVKKFAKFAQEQRKKS